MHIRDSVKVVHFTPGRVRLKVAAVKNNPAYSGMLKDAFQAVPGISSLEVNSLTGSVLIQYDKGRLLADDAILILAQVLRDKFLGLDTDQSISLLKKANL